MSEPSPQRLKEDAGSKLGALLGRVGDASPPPGGRDRVWRGLQRPAKRPLWVPISAALGAVAAGLMLFAVFGPRPVSTPVQTIAQEKIELATGAVLLEISSTPQTRIVELTHGTASIRVMPGGRTVQVRSGSETLLMTQGFASVTAADDGNVIVSVDEGEAQLRGGAVKLTAHQRWESKLVGAPQEQKLGTDLVDPRQFMIEPQKVESQKKTLKTKTEGQPVALLQPRYDHASTSVEDVHEAPGNDPLKKELAAEPSQQKLADDQSNQKLTDDQPNLKPADSQPNQKLTDDQAKNDSAQQAPDDAARFQAAMALSKSDPQAALRELQKLAVSSTRAELALYEAGRLQAGPLQRPGEAMMTFREYQRRFPTGALRPEVDLSLTEVLLRLGKSNEALAELDAFAATASAGERATEVQFLRGDILRAKGDFLGALKLFEPLSHGEGPIAEKALYLSAVCHLSVGHPESARNALREYVDRYPRGIWIDAAERALAGSK